jgi:DNA-directed RNA polymerase specialized sigma24 family protein
LRGTAASVGSGAVSPAALRTYRAERLLERDFHALRSSVLAIVAARLRARGGSLDRADLEACYAGAWQGLYGETARGRTIENPAAWLALVTYRRAIEELRSARRAETTLDPDLAAERDVDAELDARTRLRHLLEGMRCRLDLREREAAALCYLHGYSRAEAARRMGISETRMRKLMEGRGAGRAGVSQKVGALAATIAAGEFCGEQESLMRALAFGMLEPDGERHRIALAHLHACPACRRRVASLRGLAVALPPVLTLPGAGKLGLAALAAGASHGGRVGLAPTAVGQAPLGASAAAGSGAAGGGWALGGGGLAAKLAAGCLLTLGVGAGCVALGRSGAHHGHRAPSASRVAPPVLPAGGGHGAATARLAVPATRARPVRTPAARVPALAQAQNREFTPEQLPSPGRPEPVAGTAARAASPNSGAAEREFGPG